MPDPSHGTPPQVIRALSLGHAVRLGELYDQRTAKFIDVQLYSEDKIKEFQVETDVKHTDLTVSLSTTHEDKATLLDIHAELSLEILSGLISVSGSATYLHDEKANTQEYAYAMSLKTRLKEKRLLFAEEELARHVLRVAVEDYIEKDLATHFVSSIVYGGSFIVNLVARQSEFSKEDLIEGKLQAQFDKLKGVVSLKGEADVKVKEQFKNMDDKFDLVIHGDVALEKVPVNPKDVLDTFPDAAKLIKEGGGVPVYVILQPIPKAIYEGIGLVYQLDAKIVDAVLTAFSNLDDLRSRFVVLQDSAKKLQDFVPELARTIHDVATAYLNKHTELLHKLGTFLLDYQHGERPDHGVLLEEVTKLYNEHINPNAKDSDTSSQYPSSLVALEFEFSRFQNFISSIQIERRALYDSTRSPALEHSFYLSSLRDVVRSIATQRRIPLFIMTPFSGQKWNPNFAVIRYLAIVRKYVGDFNDPANPAYLFYGENLTTLERELPNNGDFANLVNPSLFLGTINDAGDLTWDSSPPVLAAPVSDVAFAVHLIPDYQGNVGHVSLGIDPVDATKAYSIQVQAKAGSSSEVILLLERAGNDTPFLSFRAGLVIFDETNQSTLVKSDKRPAEGDHYMATYVQDTQTNERILYLNGDVVARKPFTDGDIVPDATRLQIGYRDSKSSSLHDKLTGFKAFARALNGEEVKKLYSEWKK